MKKRSKSRYCIINTLFYGILSAISIILLYFLVRVFVADQFPVNTQSMSPTIKPGDRIVVNKLIFGPRIYKSLDFSSDKGLKSFRIKGYRGIRHNDIIVFNFPYSKNWSKVSFKINYVYTKRCIGLPGDSLSIINGFYRNNHFSDTLGCYPNQLVLSNSYMDSIDSGILKAFPYMSEYIHWNIKSFGPLYIPKSGDLLKISIENLKLYKVLIEYETGKKLKVIDGCLYLGIKPLSYYKFTKNYYFVGGDNVMNSSDSRYFGLVPEEFIVGVVGWII